MLSPFPKAFCITLSGLPTANQWQEMLLQCLTSMGTSLSVLTFSLAFEPKFPQKPVSITILAEKPSWISAVSQFAQLGLTLCSNRRDWIKDKSPAGILAGCYSAAGCR